MANTVVVWGNCQAEPLATLLTEPLRRHGLEIVPVPAVYLVDAAGLRRVREVLATAAVLVTQPIRDEYRIPGCGAAQLAGLLPAGARVVTVPVAFHTGTFPFQFNAHGGDGARVVAPVTDYHDLRAVVAAERGLTVAEALDWWPAPDPAVVRELAAASTAELTRREAGLDVSVSDAVGGSGAMFTITHPTNRLLVEMASRILAVLGLPGAVTTGPREFLGARRAPVEAAVARAFGWSEESVHDDWQVDNCTVPLSAVLEAHLALYAERPDIVADTRVRSSERLTALGL